MRRSREAARTGFVEQVIDQWFSALLPGLERRIAEVRTADLSAMDDEQLLAHVEAVHALYDEGLRIHFRVNVANFLALGELSAVCRDLLGWAEPEVQRLLAGLSVRSSEPARKLSALAGKTADGPEFDEYVRRYGGRSITLELADPTLAEVPGLVWNLLQDQAHKGYTPGADAAALAATRQDAAQEARKSLRGKDLDRFEEVLKRAVKAYPVREDNVFFAVDTPTALTRYAVLELGGRLAARGLLDNRDDVFFLSLDEAVKALRDGETTPSAVERRKGEHAWALANPGPRTYGKEIKPPSTRWLRADLRVSSDAMVLVVDQVTAFELSNRAKVTDAERLTGLPGSPGSYQGPVRVITSERDFGKLQAGDVLVCASTRPSWSVLYPSVGAIVTDAGGVLSHPAIIAREHRIPAVVATGYATTSLRDGQIVTVHGGTGIVEVQA
jgi:phosphohistidine swiveling domain-containing protein